MGKIKKPEKILTIYFTTAFIEGLLVLFLFFLKPSLDRNAWLWGFSRMRLFMGGMILSLVLLWGLMIFISIINNNWKEKLTLFLISIFENKFFYLIIFFGILYVIFLILFLDFIFPFSIFQQYNLSSDVPIQRLLPSAIWLLMLIVQTFLLIKLCFIEQWEKIKAELKLTQWILAFLAVFVTSCFWLSLLLQVNFKEIHPNWHFLYELKNFNYRYLFVGILLLLAWLLIKYIFLSSHKTIIKLIIIILFGYLLQVSYGFIDGGGYSFLQYYYAEAFISLSVDTACLDLNLTEIVKEYETHFSSGFWTRTKPPGFVLFFASFGKLATFLNPKNSIQGCRTGFIEVGSYLMPLISLFVLIPLTELSKKMLPEKYVLLPALIYIFTPSVLLMTQVPDQVIFPLLFISCIYLNNQLLEKRNLWLAILLGMAMYLAIFFSFSLLPVLGLFCFWFLIDLGFNFKKWTLEEISQVLIGVGGGLMSIHFLFINILNYNVFSRYLLAMESHREIKSFKLNLNQVIDVLLMNNIEFAIWIGIPIIIISISILIRILFKDLAEMNRRRFYFLLAFIGVYLALNIVGQTKAEVGRLWLFMVPGFMLIVAPETLKLIPGHEKRGVFLVVVLQLLTSLWLFRYFVFY